mgnify:CR=1 FL=1|jgi:nucleoside-diphosphate-sugar epimerase
MKSKILITGASGFVGQNLVHKLSETDNEFDIYNLSRGPLNIDGVKNIECSADNFDFSVISNMEFDYIVNLLALSHDKDCVDFEYAQSVNIDFTKRILEFAKIQKKLKKFIHLSSAIIYDNSNVPPVSEEDRLYLNYSNYSFTKGVSDYYAQFYAEKYGLPVIIFRLSNIYGPSQNFVNSPFLVPSKIVEALTEGKINVFNLRPKRDWIYSEDAVEAIIKSLDVDYNGVLNLASGKGVSVEELISEIAIQTDVEFTSEGRETSGPLNFYCDISKTTEVLNWKPTTSLEEGMKKTINYAKKILKIE